MTVFLDAAAKRIQSYLARTPRLRGRRGASALLERELMITETRQAWQDHATINEDGKLTDGRLSLRFTDGVAADTVAEVAGTVAVALQRLAPAAEWEVTVCEGDDYLTAVTEAAAERRAGRDRIEGGQSWSVPPPLAEVPVVRLCQACGLSPATTRTDGIIPGEDTPMAICADCVRRFIEGGYRTDRRQWKLAEAPPEWAAKIRPGGLAAERDLHAAVQQRIGRKIEVVETFADLAELGSGDANHLATVFIDGNRFGDLFAALKNTAVQLDQLSTRLAAAVREALAEATASVVAPGDAFLPVVPHLVGGDDLLASVTADRAWPFVMAFLTGFGERAAELAATYGEQAGRPIEAPTASAGLAFAHHKRPFADSLDLAESAMRRAKALHNGRKAAVCWLDVTFDGPELPAGRTAPTVAQLRERRVEIEALYRIGQAGRARLAATIPAGDVAVAALAHRLGRVEAVRPFLLPTRVLPLADALVLGRWWA